MGEVKNLESKNWTECDELKKRTDNQGDDNPSGFIRGSLGLTANLTFCITSPLKAFGKWIRKIAA